MSALLAAAKLLALIVGVLFALLVAIGFWSNTAAAERQAWAAIRRECERQGCSDIDAFTNSRSGYGVWYRKGGKKHRGKCVVTLFGTVSWDKNNPADIPDA